MVEKNSKPCVGSKSLGYRAGLCITVSRLLLVPVAKGL